MKNEFIGSVMVFKSYESGETLAEGTVPIEITDYDFVDGPGVVEIAWTTPNTKQRTYLRIPLGELVNKSLEFVRPKEG